MPIYEYACSLCGHQLETIQKMEDAPLLICPECNKPSLERLVSAAGFRLRGGGWYETDFKQGDKKKNLAEGETKTDTSIKTDSKPESTTPVVESSTSKSSKPDVSE